MRWNVYLPTRTETGTMRKIRVAARSTLKKMPLLDWLSRFMGG